MTLSYRIDIKNHKSNINVISDIIAVQHVHKDTSFILMSMILLTLNVHIVPIGSIVMIMFNHQISPKL